VPVLAWAALIFYLSSIPYLRITLAWWDILARKAAHMFMFGVLARLLARAFQGQTPWSWKRIFTWSLALSFLYACSDEWHQRFVPGRQCAATDVLIDSFGAWLALVLKP
jgi:VanZ family protein